MTDSEDTRKRGILSSSDREYLTDREDYTANKHRQTVSERQSAVQQRLRDAILDFPILVAHLPSHERERALGFQTGMVSPEGEGDGLPDAETLRRLEDGVRDGVTFLHLVANDLGDTRQRTVRDGIRQAEELLNPGTQAEVEVEVDLYDTAKLARRGRTKMNRGEDLTDSQVRALLESEQVADEKVGQYLRGETQTE